MYRETQRLQRQHQSIMLGDMKSGGCSSSGGGGSFRHHNNGHGSNKAQKSIAKPPDSEIEMDSEDASEVHMNTERESRAALTGKNNALRMT